jgi:hypothetical protein
MSESNSEELVIKDIDSPLYDYWLFYRFDIRNRFVSDRQKLIQKIKTNLLVIHLFICVIRIGIYLLVYKKGRIPLYYFDIIQHIGGITEYFYSIALIFTLLSLRIIFILNYSYDKDYEWLDIIKVLNGSQSSNFLKLYDKNEFNNYLIKIKNLKIVFNFFFLSSLPFATIIALTILFINFNYSDLINYGILSAIIYFFWASSIAPVITFSILYYLIVCYYCKIRFKSFNDYLNSLRDEKIRAFINYKTIDQLIKDHNSICSDIKNYNKFWQKYYIALTYTLIPINLLSLQLLCFEDLLFPVFFSTLSCFLGTIISHLMINSITASITSEASKSYKSLHEFYLQMNYSLNIRRKLNVIIIFF